MELTPRQQAYVRKRTKHDEPDPSEVAGELNIVPFLDIVVNLILFLLATSAQVMIVAELDAHLPSLSRGRRASSSTEQGSTLNLSVTIAENGIIVSGSGGKLAPGCTQMQSGRVITVPRGGDGTYNWRALTECVARVHSQFPDENQVILSADPSIEYEHIIQAMDAVRAQGTDPLFPNVMLSAGVR
ncbi:ExbD/TolR family protein [Sandaracinus amylolyticus]|uniref:TolR-like protein n=1 Tax=Sandaracinus amylolyticus TaxID=927083 RepID=A0A0F6YGW7_9BACT|nr:biopolymer transporter ExbD [Sandaracinus amylolyticus]AKF03332.1 TolR-like protein [Sandaracinus amylolyticus]